MSKSLVEMEREKLPDKVPLKCPKCGYEWEYGGDNPFFAQCPKCYTRMKIGKSRTDIEEEEPGKKKLSLKEQLEDMDQGESMIIEREEDPPIKIEKSWVVEGGEDRLIERKDEFWISEREHKGIRGKLIKLYQEDLDELERKAEENNEDLVDIIINIVNMKKTNKEKFKEFLHSLIKKPESKIEDFGGA